MSLQDIFQPISPDEIRERVDAIQAGYQLVAVTTVVGDLLMGGLQPPWRREDDGISLHYNAEKGRTFGTSYIVHIPYRLVADIRTIPLSEESIPQPQINIDEETFEIFQRIGAESLLISKVAIKDYPNPLASIIYHHNSPIIRKHDLAVVAYTEKALSEDATPPDGIKFNEDFLLYADWDFFSQHISGSIEVSGSIPGILQVAKVLSPSLHERAIDRLKGSVTQKVAALPSISEHWMHGCILVEQKPQDTEIQGEKCIVITCASTDKRAPGDTFPVLVKLKYLNYPREFLRYIVSDLTFYGELLPLPIEVLGKVHAKTLLARAIGYIP